MFTAGYAPRNGCARKPLARDRERASAPTATTAAATTACEADTPLDALK